LRLVIIGYGNVGRELGALLAEKMPVLTARYGLTPRIAGVATARHGAWLADDEKGIDPGTIVAADWPASAILPPGVSPFAGDPLELIRQAQADVLVELSTLNPETGMPALNYVRAAIERGLHVITANKGPIALAYHELRNAAIAKGVQLRFESTVIDGTPVINLAEFTLPATEILGVRAIINATSNFILSGMVAGQSFDEVVREAQSIGIAEANPNLDTEGWDASVKLTILANVLMGADIRPQDVQRESNAEKMQSMMANRAPGSVVKQVATLTRDISHPQSVIARVVLEELTLDDSLAGIGQGKAAIEFRTDTMGELTIIEGPGTPRQTAFGVLADLITIHSHL
jgi:homoserine dehydrogenase